MASLISFFEKYFNIILMKENKKQSFRLQKMTKKLLIIIYNIHKLTFY